MASLHLVLSLMAVILSGPALAQEMDANGRELKQFGFGPGGLFGPPLPPTPPGAGRSPADVICAQQDLSSFCQLIKVAQRDPTVAELLDPTFVGTIFAPTNSAFQNDQSRLARTLNVPSLADLQRNPSLVARVIANHIITGQALQFANLKSGQKYRDAGGAQLEISSGILYGLYVKGPVNTVRISGTAGQYDIPAGRSYLHKIDGVLIPKKA